MESNVISVHDVESRWTPMNPGSEARSSGVSWGAVIGGAFVAAAVYLILLALGAGFGLSAGSPWSMSSQSISAMSVAAIAWLIVIEIVASGLGGYLTGRLRTKWAMIHTDEVYFRDTANGFLAWAVALVISVTFLASAGAAMMGRVAPIAAAMDNAGPNAYFVDTLFRSDPLGRQTKDPVAEEEAGRIFDNALLQSQLRPTDQDYLARLISAKTGISQPEAEKRVSDVMADARQMEDAARKATAHLLLWFFLALLMGAFSASFAATIGGRQRDHVQAAI